MTVSISDSNIKTIADIKKFISGSFLLETTAFQRKEAYSWIENTLVRFSYYKLKKSHRTWVRQYIIKITGYSKSQVTRLISQYIKFGKIKTHYVDCHRFECKYQPQDVQLLAKTDRLHDYPNGNVVKTILQRMVEVYDCQEFAKIANISVAQIYNLRKTKLYQQISQSYTKTKGNKKVSIGIRKKPEPNGRPGFIRVDTIHQGDQDGKKGMYHIDLVDEVTQWQITLGVEKISENHMIPALTIGLELFPFIIQGFHADNGSEYINRNVVKLLNKLLIELTKSRPRKSNDNGLVESKHNIVRKWIGYSFIKQQDAKLVNAFYLSCFNEYLNYHKPCAFATEIEDRNKPRKIKKVYKLENYQTPYQKLISLPKVEEYLKEGVTLQQLEAISLRHSDNEMAKIVQKEREELFDLL
ncbi:MAG TPA: integrase [Oligoflexia bacterium]|nr:integrase [Oligoflexia bacterium]